MSVPIISHPPFSVIGASFLHHWDRCTVVSHFCFNLIFPDEIDTQHFFTSPSAICVCLMVKCLQWNVLPLFPAVVVVLGIEPTEMASSRTSQEKHQRQCLSLGHLRWPDKTKSFSTWPRPFKVPESEPLLTRNLAVTFLFLYVEMSSSGILREL